LKSQRAIRSYERGLIDVNTLSSVADHISSAIDEKAKQLQTPGTAHFLNFYTPRIFVALKLI
jgi:hypothetical protein